jgi:hypothetical protein
MLTRRAPTNILVCTIALWVIAGFLSVQTAYGAATGPAYHQEETQDGGGSTVDRERAGTMSVSGDPDEYAHTGDGTPLPGDGSSKSGRSFLNVLIEMLAAWWSLVWGFPPQ